MTADDRIVGRVAWCGPHSAASRLTGDHSRPAGPPVVLAAGDSQVLAVAGGAARTAGDEWKQHRARPRADQGRPLGQPPTTGTGRQKS